MLAKGHPIRPALLNEQLQQMSSVALLEVQTILKCPYVHDRNDSLLFQKVLSICYVRIILAIYYHLNQRP